MWNKIKYKSRKKKAAIVLFFALAFVAFIAAVVWVVMLLWNAILPEVISGVKQISYWQAAGLLLLSKILFSGFGGGKKHSWKNNKSDNLKNKWMNMKPEQREVLKSRWKEYCERKKE